MECLFGVSVFVDLRFIRPYTYALLYLEPRMGSFILDVNGERNSTNQGLS